MTNTSKIIVCTSVNSTFSFSHYLDINNWQQDFIEITSPLKEPPNFKELLILQEDYKKVKIEIENEKGIVLPSLIPTLFSPKSKFVKKSFESPEMLKGIN